MARHSLLCESMVPPSAAYGLRLAVLLHDAHEAYTGDIVRPMKWAITHLLAQEGVDADPIGVIEDDLDFAIMRAVGLDRIELPASVRKFIKRLDNVALAVEKRDMMAHAPRPWGDLPDVSDIPQQDTLRATYTDTAEFMRRLRSLIQESGVPVLPSFWTGADQC